MQHGGGGFHGQGASVNHCRIAIVQQLGHGEKGCGRQENNKDLRLWNCW
jgi:hypothetical protein